MSGFAVEIFGEYGEPDGSIHLMDGQTELVMWDSAEWTEDPSLVFVIAEAIRIGYVDGPHVIASRLATVRPESGDYDADDRCRKCGAHIADPHDPDCPVAAADTDADDMPEVPDDFPVRPLGPDDPATDRATCGDCGRSWDDAISTSMTPAPSARCPFEYFH